MNKYVTLYNRREEDVTVTRIIALFSPLPTPHLPLHLLTLSRTNMHVCVRQEYCDKKIRYHRTKFGTSCRRRHNNSEPAMRDSGHVNGAALFPFNIEWTLEEQITTEAVFTFNYIYSNHWSLLLITAYH